MEQRASSGPINSNALCRRLVKNLCTKGAIQLQRSAQTCLVVYRHRCLQVRLRPAWLGANRQQHDKGSVSRAFIRLPFDVQCGQTDKRAQSLDESPSATTGLARILATSLDAALQFA